MCRFLLLLTLLFVGINSAHPGNDGEEAQAKHKNLLSEVIGHIKYYADQDAQSVSGDNKSGYTKSGDTKDGLLKPSAVAASEKESWLWRTAKKIGRGLNLTRHLVYCELLWNVGEPFHVGFKLTKDKKEIPIGEYLGFSDNETLEMKMTGLCNYLLEMVPGPQMESFTDILSEFGRTRKLNLWKLFFLAKNHPMMRKRLKLTEKVVDSANRLEAAIKDKSAKVQAVAEKLRTAAEIIKKVQKCFTWWNMMQFMMVMNNMMHKMKKDPAGLLLLVADLIDPKKAPAEAKPAATK
jgi:hypothetical protein